MAFSHAITTNFSNNGGPAQSFTSSVSFDGEVSAQIDIPANTNALPVIFQVESSVVQSVMIWATADMTVVAKDPTGATTVATWNLKANVPLSWNVNSPSSNPITADLGSLVVTSGATVGVLNAYVGINA